MTNKTYEQLTSELDEVTCAMEYFGHLDMVIDRLYSLSKEIKEQGHAEKQIHQTAKLGAYLVHDFINGYDCQKEQLEKAINELLESEKTKGAVNG